MAPPAGLRKLAQIRSNSSVEPRERLRGFSLFGLSPGPAGLLEVSDKSVDLAAAYFRAGIIPAKKENDARHVAIATVGPLR